LEASDTDESVELAGAAVSVALATLEVSVEVAFDELDESVELEEVELDALEESTELEFAAAPPFIDAAIACRAVTAWESSETTWAMEFASLLLLWLEDLLPLLFLPLPLPLAASAPAAPLEP